MQAAALLTAENLCRSFGQHKAVDDLSFTLKRGEVLGFLGPNGAGKTTTMNMLSGHLAQNSGKVTINGFDLQNQPARAKSHLGYLPEIPPLYRELTVWEVLMFSARLHGIPRRARKQAVDTAMQRCGLADVDKQLVGTLSKGFQQRVGIAQAIIHTPAVVILDEPTAGLDPVQIREIRQLIRTLAAEQSVIISTHILPEVESLCDRVQIINHGRLVFSGDLDSMYQQLKVSSLIMECITPPALTAIQAIPGVTGVEKISPGRYRIIFTPGQSPAPTLAVTAANQGWQLLELRPESPTLESLFMQVIHHEDAA